MMPSQETLAFPPPPAPPSRPSYEDVYIRRLLPTMEVPVRGVLLNCTPNY